MNRKRRIVQILAGLMANAHISGFVTGRIYTGPLKNLCAPGLNCYSCPGALGACPVGALQASFTGRHPRFPFYVLGFLLLAGVLLGRFVCGWLCLFGFIQELLYKIPVPKLRVPEKLDRGLRYLKYAVLALLVILLPIILRDEYGLSAPYFCKWLCPAGTLEGGLPLLALDQSLRQAAHALFTWKFALLIICLLASVLIERPFCKYLCPLGAFYGLVQKVGFLRLRIDRTACISCGACKATCPMGVDPVENPGSCECIRCGKCVTSCPAQALAMGFFTPARQTEAGAVPEQDGALMRNNQ